MHRPKNRCGKHKTFLGLAGGALCVWLTGKITKQIQVCVVAMVMNLSVERHIVPYVQRSQWVG